MSESDTKEQILDAAEQIFGAKGFAGTSLRDVTRRAGVNLAAVNYHFGSKEGLLRAVLDRRISPVNQKRLKLLAQVEATAGEEPPSVEAILEAYISPSLHLFGSLGKQGVMLMRFFGHSHTEPDKLVQKMVQEQFGEIAQRFIEALQRGLPHLPREEIYWRFQFAVGALIFVLTSIGRTEKLPGFPTSQVDVNVTIGRLVAFLAAGFHSPVQSTQNGDRSDEEIIVAR